MPYFKLFYCKNLRRYSRRARKWNMNMWILQPPCVCQRHAVFFVSFLCLLGPCTRNFVDIGQELFVWEPTKGTASKHHFHLLYSVQLCLHLDAVLCNCSQMESSCLNWTKFRELQAKTHTDIEKKTTGCCDTQEIFYGVFIVTCSIF